MGKGCGGCKGSVKPLGSGDDSADYGSKIVVHHIGILLW